MTKSLRFLFLIGLQMACAGITQAGPSNFCGTLDFPTITNEELQNIVYLEDLSNGRPTQRHQCGLHGENFLMCSSCENGLSEDSMQSLRPMLGTKAHLDWHAKWHKIRAGADTIDATLFGKLQKSSLIPNGFNRARFFADYGVRGRLSGENFFYMHRMMIKMVQFQLAASGKSCVAPWNDLPASTDDDVWPVPRVNRSEATRQADEETLVSLKTELRRLMDPAFLKKMSLNQLGNILEPALHTRLHNFYRGVEKCSVEAVAQGYCDDLVPVETSPLNKYFWKIHGLVDQILGRWLSANGYKTIATNCEGQDACFQWQGTWVGKIPRE